MTGGDTNGANLRVANYYANNLNQLTNRDIPAYVDVMGASILTNAVTVNGQTAYRNQEYFRQQLPANNSASALWTNIIVSGGQNVTGNVYVAEQPEVFSYDADGNLTNDGRWAYTWDGENRMVQMTVNTNVGPQYTLSFTYDPKGRRIQKMVVSNSVSLYTNNFMYDGWNLIATLNPSTLLESFMWGNDLSGSPQGAGGVGGLLETVNYGVATNFVAYDGNGNVAALVDADGGAIVGNLEYGPFGEPIRLTGTAKTEPFRFSTKYDDDESDLLYYGYRYYKPSTGTWPNRDPNQEYGSINLYEFARNDSTESIDYIGLVDCKFEVIVGHSWSPTSIFGWSGEWGQPGQNAFGAYNIGGEYAESSVTVTSRTDPTWGDGNACNTVDTGTSAGTINMYLKNECPGNFNIAIYADISLTATGPYGAANASLSGSGGPSLVNGTGLAGSPFIKTGDYNFSAYVGKQWTRIATYLPDVAEPAEHGIKNTGTAYGFIAFETATPK